MLWFISLEIYSNSRPNRKVFLTRSRQCILTYYNISPWYPFCIIYLLCCPVITKSFSSYDDVIKWKLFSALLAFCAGNSPVTGEFRAQRQVTRSFDVFFDQRLNKQSSKQPWGWWFETPSLTLWRHRNDFQSISFMAVTVTLGALKVPLATQMESMRCICWSHSLPVSKPDRGPVSLTIFCPQFKFDGYFALLLFRYWPSDRNKFLHMPRQHSCRAMYKIL